MKQRIVIVGGVGGGATVAAQIRRTDKEAEIHLFEKGSYVSFSNCGMPYYLGGVLDSREDILYPAEEFEEKFSLHVHTETEVTKIAREQKQITFQKQFNSIQEGTLSYDKLILSPGAHALCPEIDGMNDERTFTLHTISDMDTIDQFIERHQPATAAVVGGGFIGLEMVENLHARGIHCTVIDRGDQVAKLVDIDLAEHVSAHLAEKNVDVKLDDGLSSFSNDGKKLHLESGSTIDAEMTILAIGIRLNTQLAVDSKLKIGNTGAIAVNEFMQTSDPDIYALGDVVETFDSITGADRHVALAWPAHRQAFIIASHLTNEKIAYQGTMGTSILKAFDLTLGSTGHTSTTLKQAGYTFKEAVLQAHSNASYYPGSDKLWIKILFDEVTGLLYSGQVVGYAGADKRLAVLATAIKGKLTVYDLQELELGYAPPFSSSKDPLNILGYKAAAML
ncbi:CoA-disulfide reductase [Oceanobacillus manasiensis]|uniref:CoA-disulfide reductase n=1 Tax=Oceanobacillus manasiensis TaxID=586413 RepID=UPI0005AA63A3|nr:CoA-disulfide reductase [Oceanobacillus manasiensis]